MIKVEGGKKFMMEERQESEVLLRTTLFPTHPDRRRVISKRCTQTPRQTFKKGEMKNWWKSFTSLLTTLFAKSHLTAARKDFPDS